MIDLRDSDALRHLAAIVADIRAAAVADFLLVGAAARDLLLLYRHGITPPRRTTDVDFAFCVPDWSRFEQLKAALVGSGRFTSGRITHRLHHRIGTPLDLIPFFDVDLAGAWLLGSHAREAIDRYGEHRHAMIARATTILERQTDPDGPLRLIGEIQAANPERARRTLVAFLNGLRRHVSLADPRR